MLFVTNCFVQIQKICYKSRKYLGVKKTARRANNVIKLTNFTIKDLFIEYSGIT